MPVTELSLALTGDLMLQVPLVRDDVPARTLAVYEILRESDLTFANLECPLTDRGYPVDKQSTLRAPPSLAAELLAIGVNVVTVANNHVYDFGPDGLTDTMVALGQAGLPYVGLGEDLPSAMAPVILTSRGVRVAFMGLSCTLPPNSSATAERAGMAPIRVATHYLPDAVSLEETPGIAPFVETMALEEDVQRAEEAVDAAAREADVVIVGIHWGLPNGWIAQFQDELATYQQPLGRRLVDAGATVLVGNHAHALQPIELHGRGIIFYSLGNFLFHRRIGVPSRGTRRPFPPYRWRRRQYPDNLETVVARVGLDATGLTSVDIHPVRLNSAREPELAQADEARAILSRFQRSCEDHGTDLLDGRAELGPLRARLTE